MKRGTLGKAGKEDSKRVVVRYEYVALFEPSVDDDEDIEDEDVDEDDGPGEPARPTGKRRGKKARHEIVAGQPLLAVRIAMFDPRKQASFEPQIQFAVMNDWTLGDSPAQPDDRFTLQSYMLKRVARALAERVGIAKGTRIRTAAAARRTSGPQQGKDRKLSCALPLGVEAVSLYSIGSAADLENVAKQMKNMWISVIEA